MNISLPVAPAAPVAAPRRQSLPLDGAWEFRHESEARWREAPVPSPWQALPGLHWSWGRATYRRRFAVPGEWAGREVAIRFGAVSEEATVRVNGREVARHVGGYLPFEAVLDPALLEADNLLEVEAFLPTGHRRPDGEGFSEVPHGKQSWYGPQGGIWQSVALEARDALHVRSVRLDPHWPEGRLEIRAALSRPAGGTLALSVLGPDGAEVHSEAVAVAGGEVRHDITLLDALPWSPDAPNLYALRLTLDGGRDERVETFGFRRIEARDGCIMLNGAPFHMRGALDQDYYPDGFGTPPSLEVLEDQARKAKAMGLNTLRCHIKVPDPRYYEVADRLGLLIWTELPNVETWTLAAARRLRDTMEGILARDRNHPSIAIWTLVNEDWGTRLREAAEERRWLSDMVDWLRAEDPLRLVVDNSACFPNWHVKTDINDFHFYRQVVDRREEWDALVREFAAQAPGAFGTAPANWTWGLTAETVREGTEPLILSEFGVWGLPDPSLLKEDGRDPWWAAYGASWGEGTVVPQGIEARFEELGLEEVFGSLGGFVEEAQWHQFRNLKYEIETLRAQPAIAGYVVTEFTDVHWEGNGLLDMARNPRVFASALRSVNADVVIAPGLAHPAARAGREVALDVAVATGGARLPEGARLRWSWDGEAGEAPLPATGPMAAARHPLTLRAPATDGPRMAPIDLSVLAPDGTVLAENREPVALYPARPAPVRPVAVSTTERLWADRLALIGHRPVEADEAEVFVTDLLDAAVVEAIHAGARVLQVLRPNQIMVRRDTPPRDGPLTMAVEDAAGGMRSGAYFSFPGYRIQHRHNSLWRGDWVGNFSWLRRDGAFAHLPGGPMLDLSFSRVIPHEVITGFRQWEFRSRVHAGVVVGWVHKPAAFVVEKRLGRGKLVLTTFRLLRDEVDADPVATALWDGLLDLALAE